MMNTLRCLLAALCCLCASAARAQATFDATANSSCSAGTVTCTASETTLTYALTVGAGSNRALAVFVSVGCNSGQTAPQVSTLTYAGQSLSQTFHENGAAGAYYTDLWALPAGTQPTSGTNNVVVVLASNITTACSTQASLMSGAISASGVDQTTTFSSSNGDTGTSGTTASVTISTSGGTDLGISQTCAGSSLSLTTETSRWNAGDVNTACNEYGGATAAGGDTSFSWTISGSDSWAMVAAAFKAAGGGGGPTCRSTLGLLGVSQCGH